MGDEMNSCPEGPQQSNADFAYSESLNQMQQGSSRQLSKPISDINEAAIPSALTLSRRFTAAPSIKEPVKAVEMDRDPAFHLVWQRELYVGLVGVHAIFVFVNLVFANYSGALLVLLGALAGAYAHIDRRCSTYTLNVAVQVVLFVVITVSVSIHFPGFDKYYEDESLRSISIGHIPITFIFALLSSWFAYKASVEEKELIEAEINRQEAPLNSVVSN